MNDPRLSELVARAAAINLPHQHEDITGDVLRIGGDLARGLEGARSYADITEPIAASSTAMGELVLSALRWMDVLGFDPVECLAAGEAAQRARERRPR